MYSLQTLHYVKWHCGLVLVKIGYAVLLTVEGLSAIAYDSRRAFCIAVDYRGACCIAVDSKRAFCITVDRAFCIAVDYRGAQKIN